MALISTKAECQDCPKTYEKGNILTHAIAHAKKKKHKVHYVVIYLDIIDHRGDIKCQAN